MSNGDAVVASPDLGWVNGDAGAPLDMDAVRVGALIWCNDFETGGSEVGAVHQTIMEVFAVQRRYAFHQRVSHLHELEWLQLQQATENRWREAQS